MNRNRMLALLACCLLTVGGVACDAEGETPQDVQLDDGQGEAGEGEDAGEGEGGD